MVLIRQQIHKGEERIVFIARNFKTQRNRAPFYSQAVGLANVLRYTLEH